MTYDILTEFPEKITNSFSASIKGLLLQVSSILFSDEIVLATLCASILAIFEPYNRSYYHLSNPLLRHLDEEGHELISILIEWIEKWITGQPHDSEHLLIASSLLGFLLQDAAFRRIFCSKTDLKKFLFTKAILSSNAQIQYQVIFAAWIISFEPEMANEFITEFDIIAVLNNVSRYTQKDKILRLCTATIRNYVMAAPKITMPILIGLEYSKTMSAVESRCFDEELHADLVFLNDQISTTINSLNSFDEYVSEIKSGHLDWCKPNHQSESFWKENAPRLAENDFEVLKGLLRLMQTSNNHITLSVICNDIRMYILHHILGASNIENLGIKAFLLSLLTHPDPDVRFYALSAMEAYTLKKWYLRPN